MPYTNFKLDDLEEKLGISNRKACLFTNIQPVEPSDWLIETLSMGKTLSLRSEKAKSEVILSPILMDLRRKSGDYFSIHSGEVLNADAKRGLNGECDFLLSKNTGEYSINLPIFSIVEAKKGDIDLGIAQCGAQMVGANIFNTRRKKPVEVIYGCTTNANEWQFLRLENNQLLIDTDIYFFSDLPKILGVFNQIFNYYKATIG
jgi:hypothetical protein